MIYHDGGEVGFVSRIVEESFVLRGKIRWYTTMFGYAQNVGIIVEKLRARGISNYAVAEFDQGKTKRWGLAWSFLQMRPDNKTARTPAESWLPKGVLPAATAVDLMTMSPKSVKDLVNYVLDIITKLDLISWDFDQEKLEGIGKSSDKVWARAWRRNAKRKRDAEEEEDQARKKGTASEMTPIETDGNESRARANSTKDPFGFKIYFVVMINGKVLVGCRWLEGLDEVCFESFQGFLIRKLRLYEDSKAPLVTVTP